MGAAALSCILALGVLANDDPVDVAIAGVFQCAVGARERPNGTDVGVELQGSTKSEQ